MVQKTKVQTLRASFATESLNDIEGRGKEGNMIKGFNFAAGLIIVIVLQGCSTLHVQRHMLSFQNRPEKLPLEVGLFLSDKERNYDITVLHRTKFMIGEALEVAAVESLGKVFRAVSIFSEKDRVPPDIERIIIIKFSPETSASTSGGFRKAKTELFCEVYGKEWNLLWKETSIGNATLEIEKIQFKFNILGGAGGGAASGYAAAARNEREMIQINTESLVSALEQLNDKILTTGKEPILRGK